MIQTSHVMHLLSLCHFQKFGFLGSKMAAYEELITPIYTLFCPFKYIGKTTIATMGYKTLVEQIKTVRAWNILSRH